MSDVKICGIEVGEYGVGVDDGCVEGPYAATRADAAEALHAMILRLAKTVGGGR